MFAHTIMMLAAAAAVAVDPAGCRRTSSGRTGAAGWESDGKGHLSVSVDAPSAGDVSFECRIRVPAGARSVSVSFDHAYVSFQPAGSKSEGSGLLLSLGTSTQGALTRVAGEDWIQSRNRSWTAPVEGKTVTLRVTAHDASDRDPLRIDLDGLRITFD